MEDTPDDVVDSGGSDGAQQPPGVSADSEELEVVRSTTLVEVTPGIAVVFGEVPEGLHLIDFGLIPEFDRSQLFTTLGTIGNLGTIGGNVAELVSNARGLYRIDEATRALLNSGAKLAVKDSAKLGSIFKNGELIAQARFIPVGMSAASLTAAVGPAIAMMAIQMQLGEISGLVHTNIALTTQMLKTIRNEQWSELEGLSEAIEEAIKEASQLGVVSNSIWDPVRANRDAVRKQLDFYPTTVKGHVEHLHKLNGHARREYLESNAEAMILDTRALLISLKAYASYQALRASHARALSPGDEHQAELIEHITRTTLSEIEKSLAEIKELAWSLVRELRIVAELPGKATLRLPGTKKRNDYDTSRSISKQILEAIEPLTNDLCPAMAMPEKADIVCAPEGPYVDRHLDVLGWLLEYGEVIQGIAFPCKNDMQKHAKAASLVAVTDRRIITTSLRTLTGCGELENTYPMHAVRYALLRPNSDGSKLPVLSIMTEQTDIRWTFPADADLEQIAKFADLVKDVAANATKARSSQGLPRSTSTDLAGQSAGQ